MAPKYEKLTAFQKIEVFENALSNSSGQDLYRILWLKSSNCETWLLRRTTYTRSLAASIFPCATLAGTDIRSGNVYDWPHPRSVSCFDVGLLRV